MTVLHLRVEEPCCMRSSSTDPRNSCRGPMEGLGRGVVCGRRVCQGRLDCLSVSYRPELHVYVSTPSFYPPAMQSLCLRQCHDAGFSLTFETSSLQDDLSARDLISVRSAQLLQIIVHEASDAGLLNDFLLLPVALS